MLDFSWSELMVVIVVAVLAVGPKQLPEVLHGLGRIVRRIQAMKFAASKQFDEFMDQADLKELRDHTARLVSRDYFDEAAADAELMQPISPPDVFAPTVAKKNTARVPPPSASLPHGSPVQESLDLQNKTDDPAS